MAVKPTYEELERRVKELENGILAPKRSEEAPQQSAGRFRRLFEQASDAFFIHDFNNGKIVDANESAYKHLGYTRDELLELNVSDIEIHDSPEAIVESCNKVKKGDPVIMEGIHRRKDGSTFPVEVSLSMLQDENPALLLAIARDTTEQKMAEQALRESEEKYKRLFDSSPEAIALVDEEGKFLTVNSSMAKRFEQNIEGKTWHELMPEDLADSRLEKARRAIETEKLVLFEDERAGRTMENYYVPIPTSGEKRIFQVIARDITDRTQAEKALGESEERYRTLINNAGESIIVAQDGIIRFANPRGEKLYGRSQEELASKPLTDFIHEEDRDMVGERHNARLRGEKAPDVYSFRILNKAGDTKWVQLNASPFSWDNEPAVLCYMADITDFKQAEEALRESEEFHRDLFENSPTALYLQDFSGVEEQVKRLKSTGITDLGGYLRENPKEAFQLSRAVVFLRVNQAAVDIYKAGSKETLLGSLDRFIIKGDFHHFIDQVVAFTNDKDSWAGEARNYNLQRDIIDIVIRKKVINRRVNGMSKVLVSVTDVTELHQAHQNKERLEAQLQQAQKMEAIGTLAGGVAHDLNNILGGLVSYPELLLLQLPPDSPLRKSVLTIQKSGEKAAAVVQDLLTLARRGVVVTEVVNLNDVIAEYLKSPEHENLQSFHPTVHMETHLEKDILNILGSSIHLSKTIMNLISNAAEAMSEGGKLTVSTENRYIDRPIRGYENVKRGDYVVFTISDTGTGISPEDIGKIFEPFYTKKKRGRSGTGLGMAVVWGTVKDHNGYIDVQSTEGKGATFTLYFPVTREKLPEDDSHFAVASYCGNGESILIVDDVEEQRNIASGMLKELGYSVVSVSRGEEAVEYLKANKVDLLVLDMIMDPGMDGLDTYRKILEMHPGQKALIASGFSETNRVKALQDLGGGTYVKKPFLLERIGLAVKEQLEK